MEDLSPIDRLIAAFQRELTDFLFAWNRCERASRSLLVILSGSSPASYILTSELQNRGLKEAVSSFATHGMNETERAATEHLLTYFERLSAYRNYYVHGIQMIIVGAGDQAFGVIETVSAKGSVKVHRQDLTIGELNVASQRALNLSAGLARLAQHFQSDDERRSKEPRFLPSPEELRRDFPWPSTLKKPQDFLL